jgi:hypothetical protein
VYIPAGTSPEGTTENAPGCQSWVNWTAVNAEYLAKNERDTRIPCTRHQATSTRAAFIEESRMKFINANKLHRKSGGVGHPSFLREREQTLRD